VESCVSLRFLILMLCVSFLFGVSLIFSVYAHVALFWLIPTSWMAVAGATIVACC
jgi:hypothetical protein